MKIRQEGDNLIHYCPGCKTEHTIETSQYRSLQGTPDSPTVVPSIKQGSGCHYFIINGAIKYYGGSTHDLRGATVELPNLQVNQTGAFRLTQLRDYKLPQTKSIK